jgi:hypothetical protein
VGLNETPFENDWEIWVYPAKKISRPPSGQEVQLVGNLEALLGYAEKESRVLCVPSADAFRKKVALGFSSIFWNTLWTGGQAPHTLGILCDPLHPALAGFPSESHTNWQWWDLIHGASALFFDHLPGEVRPVVQIIDDWVTNQRLGLLFEARLGKCRFMITGMDLLGAVHLRHAARQFRQSLTDYMASPSFNPVYQIDQVALKRMLGHPPADT